MFESSFILNEQTIVTAIAATVISLSWILIRASYRRMERAHELHKKAQRNEG